MNFAGATLCQLSYEASLEVIVKKNKQQQNQRRRTIWQFLNNFQSYKHKLQSNQNIVDSFKQRYEDMIVAKQGNLAIVLNWILICIVIFQTGTGTRDG